MRFPGGRGGKGHGGFLAGGEFEDHRRSASRVPTRIARHHSSFTFAARATSPHILVSVSINCANSAAVLPTGGASVSGFDGAADFAHPKPAEPEPNRRFADNKNPRPCGQISDDPPIHSRPFCS